MSTFLKYGCPTFIPPLQDDLAAVWKEFHLLCTHSAAGSTADDYATSHEIYSST